MARLSRVGWQDRLGAGSTGAQIRWHGGSRRVARSARFGRHGGSGGTAPRVEISGIGVSLVISRNARRLTRDSQYSQPIFS